MNKLSIIFSFALLFVLNTGIAQTIAGGGWHSVTVCSDGTVKCFGENASGQLGNNATTDSNIPVTAQGLNSVVAVSAGGDQNNAHSMALKADGTVWAWGSNLYGGLGNGTTTGSLIPIQTNTITSAIAISAGGWFSSALRSDGTVWTWGHNADGQLGNNATTNSSSPAQVNGISNVARIAAGTYHMLALKNDGTVWAWGDNSNGQIGDGTTTDKLTPVQVQGLTGVVHITAGRFFSLAVKNDGTVWTWGENLYGQLGNASNTNSSVPVQVTGLSGITTAVAATGAFHCMASKNDGTVWAWGRNTYGNLGNNTTTDSNVPVLLSGFTNAVGLAAGTNFSLMIKADGTFWGCGRNASGQLGDGTNTQRNVATQATSLCPVLLNATFPLAQVLSELHAYNKGTYNLIEWKFSHDKDLKEIVLERSVDALNFETIYNLASDDLRNNGQEEYLNYSDYTAMTTSFYRLTFTDYNGGIVHSLVQKVERENLMGYQAYPNPVNDYIIISGNSNETVSMNITTMTGLTVKQDCQYHLGQPISTRELPSGWYLIAIHTGDKTNMIKFLKN